MPDQRIPSVSSLQKLLQPLFPGLMGVALREVTDNEVTATLHCREELCTVGHAIHGGALMAFADTLGALGCFVNLPEGMRTTTIESKTNFIGSAAAGTTIVGKCRAVHKGKTTMVWQTEISNEAGKLIALVTQTQLVLPA